MNPPAQPSAFIDAPRPGDFASAVNLLAILGESNRNLAALESEIEAGYLEIVADKRAQYAVLQSTVSDNQAALEIIARRNPQWFAEKKTVTTPFGTVKFTSSQELVVANEEVSIKLIQALNFPQFLRQTTELNRDALADLSEADLAKFALTRRPKETLKVDTKVVDLGKAVKAAEKTERAAAKTARKAGELTGVA